MNAERKELFDNGRPSYWNTGKGLLDDADDDDDEPIGGFGGQASGAQVPSVDDLRKQQIRIIEDQNEGLDALSRVISRQKHLALRIGDEVEGQTGKRTIQLQVRRADRSNSLDNLDFLSLLAEIIDDLNTRMENTGSRINSETRNVDIVMQRDSTGWYWFIIIALFITNVIVALL